MGRLTMLGTGNFLAPGRYWNGFVLDRNILVEPSPTALPHLRRCGIGADELDCVVISHFHPDHTFGWPFLALELALRSADRGDRPLYVVGPPGVPTFLADMMRLGSVTDVHDEAHRLLDIRYVEVDEAEQQAGPLRFRAVRVEHVPDLSCFGYIFERDGRRVAYSGDLTPCPGLDELAASSDVLVLECNSLHASAHHMDVGSARVLRDRFPDLRIILTHVGEGVAEAELEGIHVPADFEVIEHL